MNSKASKRDRAKYVNLNTALGCVGEKLNLIGIVKDFKLPRASAGSDNFLAIRLADGSHESPGVPLTFFGISFEDLPLVRAPGDIIIVSRAKIKNHDGIIIAEYHKKYSSFALYEGRNGTNFNLYHASTNFDRSPLSATLRKEEQSITELRTWLVNFKPDTYNLKMIRDMEENQVFSFVGLIVYKQVYQGRWFIYFWDGSNAPPVSIKSRLDDESGNLVKLQLEPEPVPRVVLSSSAYPGSGTVLRITLGEGDMHMSHDFLRIGQYVNLDNIKCEVRDDLWCAVVLCDTKIRYVPQDTPLQFHCQRCKFGQGSGVTEEMVGCCISPPTEITEVDPVDLQLFSLVDALSCSSGAAEFKCIVRVVAVFPWPIEDVVSIDRVRLTLEDPTARIHALLCEEDGEYFMNGLVGNDLSSKLKLLVGLDDEHDESKKRNPPRVMCGLKYSDNPSGSREFKIFGTRLQR